MASTPRPWAPGTLAIVAVRSVALPVILALLVLVGVAVVVFVIRSQTLLQVSVSDADRGRLISALREGAFRLAGGVADGAIASICPVPYLPE